MTRGPQPGLPAPAPLFACTAGAAALAVLAALGAGSRPAHAQTPPAAPTAPVTAEYVDREITGLEPDTGLQLKATPYDATGWLRSWHVDYSLVRSLGVVDSRAQSIGIGGTLDTPNHGALSGEALITQSRDEPGPGLGERRSRLQTWRLDQRGLPLDGGWLAHHSAGDISTPIPGLARGIGRVFLPSTPVRGLSAEWEQRGRFGLNVSAGDLGVFNGFDLGGFTRSGGRLLSAGGQAQLPVASGNPDSRSTLAAQLIEGRDLPGDGSTPGLTQTRALWTTFAWEGRSPWADQVVPGYTGQPIAERPGGLRVQANALHSNSTRPGDAAGYWVDAAWRTDWLQNSAGVFRFDPGLRWGPQVLVSDLRGAYWRGDVGTRQWQAGLALEASDSLVGPSSPSRFASLYGRYRLDSRNTLSGTLNWRNGSAEGHSLQLGWDRLSDWGRTQWRLDQADVGGVRSSRYGLEQSWAVGEGRSFSTALARDITRVAGISARSWQWALLATSTPISLLSIDASLRGASGDGADSLQALVGLRWQLGAGWSVGARYSESRGQEPQAALVTSALASATLPAAATTPTNRSLLVTLRYEERAGSAVAPLGGAPGTGAGSISGAVFFDADNNGRREASEAGVPGVTIVLDRRFTTRTDAQGRYAFAFVAAGDHTMEMVPDNVPLPWSPALREPARVGVVVRQGTTQDFAVQRDR